MAVRISSRFRRLPTWLIVGVVLLAGFSGPGRASNPPDIVFILTDDQAYQTADDMPFTWDLFSHEGVIFSEAVASTPMCGPSRASMLSGLYAFHHGVVCNENAARDFRRRARNALPVWLQRKGYRTALFGKYMNGYKNLGGYQPPGWVVWRQSEQGAKPAAVVEFITSVPAGTPIFLWLSLRQPHAPAVGLPEDRAKFSGFLWRPPSWNEADVSDKPPWVRRLKLFTAERIAKSDSFHIGQLAELQAADRIVHQVVDGLKAAGRWDNTVLAFASDNGLSWGEHRVLDTKRCVYEECLRVPLMIRVPGIAAKTDPALAANIDLPLTFADLAGATPPDGLDGRSLMPLLRGDDGWRDEVLIEFLGEGVDAERFQGVRTAQWTYAEYRDGSFELYDRVADPYQLQNVAGVSRYAGIQRQLRDALHQILGY